MGPSTRQMGKDEYERLIVEKHKIELNFDSQLCKGAKISDISRGKITAFLKRAKEKRGLDIDPNASVLEILKRAKVIKDQKITNGVILLFGKDPQRFFLQAELKAIRFRGYDETGKMTDFKTISDDAITLLEKAENFIYDHIPMRAWIESGKLQRQEKWLYPPDAIREGLANALAHREYKSTGKVQIRIFDDRLEIWNPGQLPPELTVEKLKDTHDSIPRNPSIARAFFLVKFAEDVGTGTRKMVQWCKEWGLPEPTYKEAGGSFVVTFHNPKGEDRNQKTREKTRVETREKTREKILRLIKENPAVTTSELADKLEISLKGVEWNIGKIKKEGLLKRIGPDKGGHWEVHN